MKFLLIVLILLGLSTQIQAQKIFATVNGEQITINDINIMLNSFKEKRSFSELPEDQRKLIIEQTIENKILQQNAKKENIEKEPTYIATLQAFKNKIIVEVWMKKVFKNIEISQKEIQEYYNKNRSEFDKKEQVKARHIVVEKKEQALELIKKLNNTKGDIQKEFIKLAKENSIGPSAKKGGDLGWFAKGVMLESFWEKAKSLEKNNYSKTPIQTKYGYHIIFVDAKQSAYTIELEKIKPTIERKIKMQKFQSIVSSKINKLKEEAVIKR